MATTITLNSTNAQDVIIQRVVDKENILRAAQTPPLTPYTITTYITSILVTAFQGWKASQDREDLDALLAAWATATPAQKATVKSTLGV